MMIAIQESGILYSTLVELKNFGDILDFQEILIYRLRYW